MAALQTAVVLAMLGGTPDGTVLVFSSKSCSWCQVMAPSVQRLKQQGYAIRKVDFDRERSLASRFDIQRLPTTVLLVGGRERERYVGYLEEDQLRRMARSIPVRKETVTTPQLPTARDRKPADRPQPSRKPTPARPVRFSPTGSAIPSVIRANISDAPRPASTTSNPLAVCARIRVHDSRGLDVGSGTVIDSRPGRTIILTCGHIFRHYDSNGRIEVDLFGDQQHRTSDGKLIDFDLKSDVGLISISTLHPVPAAKLAATPAAAGQHVFSIGCGGGDPPTRLQHLVTSTTRYKAGFIECTGTPNQGRSGGGLFSTDGDVLGVCVLADPKARRGLYAGLPAVHSLLTRAGFSHLRGAAGQVAKVMEEPPFEAMVDEPEFEPGISATMSESVNDGDAPPPRTPLKLTSVPVVQNNQPALPASVSVLSSPALQEQLSSLRGAEVICIVRDRNNPEGKSRIIVIHEASDRFIADLTGEFPPQMQQNSRQSEQEPRSTSPTKLHLQPVALPLPLPEPAISTNQTVHRVSTDSTPIAGRIQRYQRRP